jgi:hypothetical protein
MVARQADSQRKYDREYHMRRRIFDIGSLPRKILDPLDKVRFGPDGKLRLALVRLPKDVVTLSRFALNRDSKSFKKELASKMGRVSVSTNLSNVTLEGDGLAAAFGKFTNKRAPNQHVRKPWSKAKVASVDQKLRLSVSLACRSMDTIALNQGIGVLTVSVMKTLCDSVQPAHLDFPPLQQQRRRRGREERHCLPDIAVYPISPEGMLLYVWPVASSNSPVDPILLFIPYLHMLVMSGCVTHAGGVLTPSSTLGNPRIHLYINKEGGDPVGPVNKIYYHSQHDSGHLYPAPKEGSSTNDATAFL